MSSKEYLILNIIFAALLFCLFISSYFVESNPLISCQVLGLTGKECNSCGLTRDFRSFSHLNFNNPINSQSIIVYSWFMLQFLIRILLIQIPSNLRDRVVKFDIIFSIVSGIGVFLPFWI
jgi:hypothetical protein